MPQYLPSRDSGSVTEGSHEESIDATLFLQNVQHLLGAFIQERNGIDLNANDRLCRQSRRCGRLRIARHCVLTIREARLKAGQNRFPVQRQLSLLRRETCDDRFPS